MFTSHFYHSIFKNSIKIFGKLFSNINIKKGNDLILVPISYSAKDKIVQKYNQYLSQDEKDELTITLPRMGFLMGDPMIDKTRQLNRVHKLFPIKTKDKKFSSFNSIPYTVPFYLSIITKNSDEMFQIVEQIVPFFSPDFSITIKDVPELELETDYVYKLDSISQEQNSYDGTFDERRLIIWTISFNCELNLYFPVIESKLIKKIIIDGFQDDEMSNDIFNFSTEVIPFEANATDVHILKDIWTDEQEDSHISFMSESYEVFVTNFKNVIEKDFVNQEEMDAVWNLIQHLMGVINENKNLNGLISMRKSNFLEYSIFTSYYSEITVYIINKDKQEFSAFITGI